MTSLMTEAIRKMVDRDSDYEKDRKAFFENIRSLPHTPLRGKIHWMREEMHER